MGHRSNLVTMIVVFLILVKRLFTQYIVHTTFRSLPSTHITPKRLKGNDLFNKVLESYNALTFSEILKPTLNESRHFLSIDNERTIHLYLNTY